MSEQDASAEALTRYPEDHKTIGGNAAKRAAFMAGAAWMRENGYEKRGPARTLTPCGNIACTGCRICGCPALGIAAAEREPVVDDATGDPDYVFTIDADYLADSTVEICGEIVDERVRAHEKHRDHSMESWPALASDRYLILAEEVGEVAKEFNDAKVEARPVDAAALRAELIQVATMAVAWVAALSEGATA